MKTLAIAVSLALATSTLAAERAIEKEALVKASAESVWDAWTTQEGITSFFAPDARVEARPEGAFEIYMNPYAAPGMKGADGMRFLALQKPRMLSFTWNAPPSLPEARAQRTVVIVRLEEAPEGQTRVALTHLGWGTGGQWDEAFKYFDRAWGNVLANLQQRFATGPMDWTAWRERMKAAAEKKPG